MFLIVHDKSDTNFDGDFSLLFFVRIFFVFVLQKSRQCFVWNIDESNCSIHDWLLLLQMFSLLNFSIIHSYRICKTAYETKLTTTLQKMLEKFYRKISFFRISDSSRFVPQFNHFYLILSSIQLLYLIHLSFTQNN